MSKKTTILTIVVAAVLLLAVVAIALNAPNRKTADQTATNDTETTQQTPASSTENQDQQVAATISYTDNGFSPDTVTVKSGDAIRIENKSSSPLSFNSGDHPTHTKDSELNVGNVPQGGNKTFTVTKKGTWSFHNHDNAADTGTIIVE